MTWPLPGEQSATILARLARIEATLEYLVTLVRTRLPEPEQHEPTRTSVESAPRDVESLSPVCPGGTPPETGQGEGEDPLDGPNASLGDD